MAPPSPHESERIADATVQKDERLFATLTILAIMAIGVFAVRMGSRGIGENDGAFAATIAGIVVALVVSATISRTQFLASGYPTLAFTSNTYGISALLLVSYAAVMPRTFSPTGFGFGEQSAIWLWTLFHVFFCILSLAYAIAEFTYARRVVSADVAKAIGYRWASSMTLLASSSVALVLFFHDKLPSLGDASGFSPLYHRYVEFPLIALGVLVFVAHVIATRWRHTTGIWLGVTIIAFAIETYVAPEVVHGSYTIAWYLVFAVGLAAPAFYLGVQLRNANKLLVAFAEDKKTLIEVTLRDALTGLLNRRGFDERFGDILDESRLSGKAASIVLFDIDHFKVFNDTYGHPAGDEALKRIADAIAEVANRSNDACCRVGGEEFAMVLGETDASGAMTVAERIRSAVMRLRIPQHPDYSKTLTVSVGTATALPKSKITPADLYERADKALYKAKRLGRNRIATHDILRDADLLTAGSL
jgi:diguanylate cyclase (GGDEF)-like protein